jgi:hypothetical protein
LKPSVRRFERLSALAEASEPDLRQMQGVMHQISKGSAEFAQNFTRISGWVGLAAPLVMAAVEGWAGRAVAGASRQPSRHPQPDSESTSADDAANGGSRTRGNPAAPPNVAAAHEGPVDAS